MFNQPSISKAVMFSIFFVFIFSAGAQTPIGPGHDVSGLPFDGYFDPLLYAPAKAAVATHVTDSYEAGRYADYSGVVHTGLINFEKNKIMFKEDKLAIRINLKPDDVSYFIIGVDSFFVVSDFDPEESARGINRHPEFVQFIAEFDNKTFVKHYHFTSSMGQYYAMQPAIIETFWVKEKDDPFWRNLSAKDDFKEVTLKHFGHIPYLQDKITSGVYDKDDLMSMTKMADYYARYQNGVPICYDRYWQEVIDPRQMIYSAKIINKEDSAWTLEYYKESVKLYQVSYSSFYPTQKNGDFIAYYPDGSVRKTVSFINNVPKEVNVFDQNGRLMVRYQLDETKDQTNASIAGVDITYSVVNDQEGNNILSEGATSTIEVQDDLHDLSYTKVYKKGKLSSFYRMLGEDTVFQIADPNYDYKIKAVQKGFSVYVHGRKYEEALAASAQGIVLVSLLVNKKGYVIEAEVHNSIHPEIDSIMHDFITKSSLLKGGNYRYKFKPYKKGKVKRYCEVIMPFDFRIKRTYRQPYTYTTNPAMNNMMMQQMNSVHFSPPSHF